jgi:hypothetical protein
VRNCGVSDFGVYQEFLLTKKIIRKHGRPSAIIHQIFLLNDLINESPLASGTSTQDIYRPYIKNDDLTDNVERFFRSNIKMYRMLEAFAWNVIWPKLGMISPRTQSYSNLIYSRLLSALPISVNNEPIWQVHFGPYAEESSQISYAHAGWRNLELSIQKMKTLAQDNEIPYLAVLIPHEHELVSRAEQHMSRLGYQANRFFAEDTLSRKLTEMKVPHLTLIKNFDEDIDTFVPYWGGHLNENGHKLVAQKVLSELKKLLVKN